MLSQVRVSDAADPEGWADAADPSNHGRCEGFPDKHESCAQGDLGMVVEVKPKKVDRGADDLKHSRTQQLGATRRDSGARTGGENPTGH